MATKTYWSRALRVYPTRSLRREDGTSPLKIGRSIDTERQSVNERHIDTHPSLERPQLLELLACLKGCGGKADKSRQRGAAECVDADMVQQWALAAWCRRARKIKLP
jgi:hypothetical protein